MKKFLKVFGCKRQKRRYDNMANIKVQGSIVNKKLRTEEASINKTEEEQTKDEKGKDPISFMTENKEGVSMNESNIKKENELFSEHGLNLKEEIGEEEKLIKDNSPLICPYESDILIFTKKGMVCFYNMLYEMEYKSYYDKNNLKIFISQNPTPVNSENYLIKCIYEEKKENYGENGNIKSLMKLMYNIPYRMSWDKQFRQIKKVEGNDNCYIVQTWALSPIFFVSERDSMEKRFIFDYQNATYCLSSSINENVKNNSFNILDISIRR